MNSQPQFTDYRGRKLKPIEAPLQPNAWSRRRMLLAGMLIVLVPVAAFAAVTQVSLTTQVTGILPAANGGSGAGTFTTHGVLTGEGTSAFNATAAGTSGQPLLSGGSGADPAYGTLGAAGGGTGNATNTAHGVVLGEGTSALNAAAASANGQCFMSAASNYATTDPSFQSCPSATTFYQEVPSGTVNGSNTSFTLAHTPTSGSSVILFLNGVAQTQGSSADYQISSATITYNTAPPTGSILLAQYH